MRDLPARFAFFDVDDTLIRIKSMFDFYSFWANSYHQDSSKMRTFEKAFEDMRARGAPRTELNRAYYRFFAGVHPEELAYAGAEWASHWLAKPKALFIAETVSELEHLQSIGVTPVFVSGSFEAVLGPLAARLGVSTILATKMIIGDDGVYTGEIAGPQTIGEGKASSIRSFLAKNGVSPVICLAVGDDLSDLPMLEVVGEQVVVGFNTPLARHAEGQSWRVIDIR